MEQHVWSSCKRSLNTDKPVSLQTLASIRSLIVNPHTSNTTISSILETLTRYLKLTSDLLTHHHTLKLLTDLSSYHTHLSPVTFQSIRSNSLLSADSVPLAAESLAALSSISDGDPNLLTVLDDRLFVSLCFGASIPARLRLLRNAERFGVRSYLLFSVFWGFTKDPYPYVRKEALDGLVGLCKYGVFQDRNVIERCYYRGVELLKDAEDCVRSAAVRLVSEWGQIVIAANAEEHKRDWSDTVFIQLCSMVRDMCMGVRVEAFKALGKIKNLSEDILLQTLSKKILSFMKEKKSHRLHVAERFEILASNAAGAFVHGLEDEYYEVRQSACYSLCKLVILSAEFAGQALSLLMDMLNDNSLLVRLEALGTLHHMATSECLNVKEKHMHMFVGTLIDNNDLIRSAARKIFKLVKLPSLELFRLSVDGLLENLEKYPQDEADVFSVLFHMGRNHGKFAACIISEVCQEIEPVSDGNLSLDSARVAAFLVLSISIPLSCDRNCQSVPPRLFSYAVTLLGRISSALGDIVDQNTLLAYLIQCSRSSIPGIEVDEEKMSLHEVNADVTTHAGVDGSNPGAMPLCQMGNGNSEIQSLILCESGDMGHSHVECRLEERDQIRKHMNLILTKVKDIWLLVQSRWISEALKSLRACKEGLALFTSELSKSSGVLAFTSQYLKVIELLTKLWGQMVWKVQSCEIGELEILLRKLERTLGEIRCRFIGFSKEEELHVLELTLVAYILRLSKVEMCCYFTTLKKLSATVRHIEFLQKETSTELSNFVREVKNTLHEIGNAERGVFCSRFMKLVNNYSIKKFLLGGKVRHLYAALDVPDNDSENPLPFVSGLPVGIPLEIVLHNVLSETRLWVRMAVGEESIQYVFLDINILGGGNEVTKFNLVAPFYRTKAVSFTLRVCIGMECMFEDIRSDKSCGGPKHPLVDLCPEKEVYLSMV